MYLKSESSYFEGLFRMASSCSSWMGPSYADVCCFKKENYWESFSELYNVACDETELVPLDLSFKELLEELFGKEENDLINGLLHWITLEVGDCLRIYAGREDGTLFSQLDRKKGRRVPFFFLDDFYFLEFKDHMIFIAIGNDE